MFGLSEAQYNVVKQAARKCADEVRDEIKRGGKYDQVATGIITKHHTAIATIITRIRFIWLVGYLEGRYGQQGEYE